jgi:hypothetical protein
VESRLAIMNQYLKWLILVCVLSLVWACESQPEQYKWGRYESLVYAMYHNPENARPDIQIKKLNEDIREIITSGYRVGPGIYAHLGYMYYLDGQYNQAERALEQELIFFPESRQLIERLQSSLTKVSN